ncbi:MAG: helix-turn-helix transcriptional regulator, partial [Candidatus Omnitrophica bacterium]|nr:helix-turn-helix transcriptional regulator [Candidatus Omnitrophota bacterium]
MRHKTIPSIYEALGHKAEAELQRNLHHEKIDIARTTREIRMRKKLSGVELCRRAGDLDPKTLTALEKGRIKNPSIKTLRSVARGLGVTVCDLFRESEMLFKQHLYLGSQKGYSHIEFPGLGVKVISFTPFVRDFFCGKLILAPKKRLEQMLLKDPAPIFVSILLGCFEIDVEENKYILKEGQNLFYHGAL